jgi:hypothetical protein
MACLASICINALTAAVVARLTIKIIVLVVLHWAFAGR